MDRLIYMDNAATTFVKPEVLNSMLPFFTDNYANPSSIYNFAQKSKKAVEDARTTIADIIGADKPNEIYFTAGGSESDNWALKAAAECFKDKGNHIITTKIEHHAILHTCEWLEKHGYEVTYLDVDSNGLVDIDEFCAAIKDTTIIASIMYANNEIGTIQPIKEIGAIAHEHGILFHTDAVQAFGQVPINVDECHIDMLSASGHKLNGPKGIGFLYIRKGVKIRSFVHGGAQERKRRAGTENVPGIIGLGNIGRRVADIAKAFGANVIYYSTSGSNTQDGYTRTDFDTLLATSDIISVHAPLTPNTEHLIDAKALSKMKPSAIFLNLGRGPIVVEEDLADALESGQIAAAGLDVLCTEPMCATNPLLRIKDSKKLLITPHIAWASVEARTSLMNIILGQIQDWKNKYPPA